MIHLLKEFVRLLKADWRSWVGRNQDLKVFSTFRRWGMF
jgi:hypothetical protein